MLKSRFLREGVPPMPARLTREELLEVLRDLQRADNTEAAHYAADRALLAFIGDPAITFAFGRIRRWYS